MLIKRMCGTARKADRHYAILNKVTKEITPKVSLAVAARTGGTEKVENVVSDKIYFVLEGRMRIITAP
jgi:mannose-6-phosphate isomerase-like protein (cupin superfamily)